MESHGGDVELLGIEDGVARLRLQGSCSGCGASQATLELAIERALEDARARPARARRRGRGRGAAAARRRRRRTRSGSSSPGVAGLERGRPWPPAAGSCVANVAGTLLAYHDRCAGCGGAWPTASWPAGS